MNILLIDDEGFEMGIYSRVLPKHGITVHWAPTVLFGADLIDMVPEHFFDMVLVDITGTSLDLKRDLKKINHNNVVLISKVESASQANLPFVVKDRLVDFLVQEKKNKKDELLVFLEKKKQTKEEET